MLGIPSEVSLIRIFGSSKRDYQIRLLRTYTDILLHVDMSILETTQMVKLFSLDAAMVGTARKFKHEQMKRLRQKAGVLGTSE